jgi:hypothetical protein
MSKTSTEAKGIWLQRIEKGLNRKEDWQVEQDSMNQSNARRELEQFLGVDIETKENFSIWDWEFYRDGNLLAIGEYRRRFHNFGTFSDFQFSQKKFEKLEAQGKEYKVSALFFVEFDDIFLYFLISGKYPTKVMRRNHEVRTEECVCIPNNSFLYVNDLLL